MRERNNSQYGLGEDGYNGRNFSIGFGIGSSKMYGDWAYSNPQPVYLAYFEKNATPTISLGWTISVGDLSTRDPFTSYRSFNHFTSVDQHITFELGSLFGLVYRDFNDYFMLKLFGGLYTGVGLGIINSDVKRIANFNTNIPGSIQSDNPTMLTNSTALYVPFNFGYNFYIPRLWIFKGCVFNVNYQYTMTMSDYIDGYKPNLAANKKNDIYSVASVGFRFFIFHPAEF
ncbi:hypothetical protein GCM10023093_22870 [Nemorincola caseinilytica]|uniref:Outer membrane protein beta-barrel domain-containing protein n=1 Tax=Nemorincola caseinilytica TaxID=2054315 RepID=A0ABP8NL84_9BACT